MTICTDCGGTVIEYDQAAGNGFCVKCGTVVEENTIVNEVTFGETASGGAMVQGSYVGQGATHARMSGPFGNRGSVESREQTIATASRKIQSIANILRLSDTVCLAATRLYTLAVEHKFTKGRRSLNVVAVCLYVACRQKETRNYMLIDFSDLLQVNVFELGHTYLQLVQVLNLRLPLVDPSHYISRFATLLEFGDETNKVATDAVRLVQRFDRDWMSRGRRPAGICGAALLLAARMNNFRRSIEEIVQVVKIADTTLKKRLEEFKNTPSGQLTLADFRSVWLEDEMDPPAFTKGKELEEKERSQLEKEKEVWSIEKEKENMKRGKKRKRKRRDSDDEGPDDEATASTSAPPPQESSTEAPVKEPLFLPDGILAGIIDSEPASPIDMGVDEFPIDPTTVEKRPAETNSIEETVSTVLVEEVSSFLQNTQAAQLTDALNESEQRRLNHISESVVEELQGLDEAELDQFILSEEEVKIKERVWVELNREYLEALAAKSEQEAAGTLKPRKRKKMATKPRDASTAHGTSAADSVRKLIKKNPKYSKRINYEALKDLFVEGTEENVKEDTRFRTPNIMLDEKSDMYKTDEPGMGVLIIQDDGKGEMVIPNDQMQDDQPPDEDDVEGDMDAEDEPLPSWEDAYEQEI